MSEQPLGRPGRVRVRGFHWFASDQGAARRRRASDAVLLGGCLLALLVLGRAAPGPTDVDEGLTQVLAAVPDWLDWVFVAGYVLAAAWAVVLLLVALLTPGRRSGAGLMLAAALVAFGVAGVTGWAAGTGWDRSWSAMWSAAPPPVYVAVRVAVVAAVVSAAAPYVGRPVRSTGRALLAVVALSAVAIGIAYPIGAVAGLLVGVAAAAVVHLVVGSPAGRPSPARVREALADLGIADAEVADRDGGSGAALYSARRPDGTVLDVAVLGRDERDAQLLTSAWTAATRRGERLSLASTRQGRVERAAMVSLLAERAGVRVPSVVVAGRSAEGDALLVTRAPDAVAFADLPPESLSDSVLDDAWVQLLRLHDAGIAHGRIDGRHVLRDADGRCVLGDLGAASAAAPDSAVLADRVRLLAATALTVGTDRAVAAAARALGPDDLAAMLPYLQPAVLDRASRVRIRDGEWDLDALRQAVADTVGVEPPPLERIQRVTGRSVLKAVVVVALTFGLISAFAGIDFAEVWSDLQSADWTLLGVAFVVAPLAAPFFAFSTIGATTTSLRYFPVLMLEYALLFIALVLPATAARIAMDVRFYQSFGIAAGAAVSIGVIDSLSGFVVQIGLLLVIALSGLPGFTSPVSSSSSGSSDSSDSSSDPSLLALTVAIGLVSLAIVLVVPTLRQRYIGRLKGVWTSLVEQARDARGALEVLRRPLNVLQMLGGNLGGQVVQAVVLGICLAAFGQEAALSQLILINTAVALFAGLMPVPGGVGVAEAGLTAGLQAIGIPATIAVSTAIAFRLVTFYLPPLYGSFAMRWLRRHSYV